MAVKINELDLGITASTSKALKAIDKLTNSLQKLKRVSSGASKGAASIVDIDATGSATAKMGNATGRVNAFSKGISELGKRFSGLRFATSKTTSGFTKLFNAMKRIAFYRAIRTFIKALTSGISEGIKNLVRYEQAFRKIEDANYVMSELGSNWLWIKNSMGAVAVTILNALLPAIQKLASALVSVINLANHFISAFAGKDQYAKATKSAYNYATALGAVKKQLFGFDELNILNSNSENGGASLGSMFEPAEVSDKLKGFAVTVKDGMSIIITAIKENLDTIAMLIGGAYAAIGLILLLTGQGPVGLGLLVAGLTSFAIGYGIDRGIIDSIKGSLTEIMSWVGTMLIPIGLMLAMTGHIPLGIGLIIGGAAALGTEAAIDKGLLTGDIKSMVTEITAILGTASMAIGAILLMSPASFALGLGLLFGGAVALGTAIAFNPSYFADKLKEMWAKLKTVASNFKNAIVNWLNSVWNKIKSFADKIGEFILNIPGINLLANGLAGLFTKGNSGTSWQGISARAEGGTVNTGQLFIANEAGPELVGQVNGKTTVTNQDQFISGLASANETVVQATLAIGNAIVNAINSKDTTIQLDGATVSRQIYKSMQTESTRRGTSLIQGA